MANGSTASTKPVRSSGKAPGPQGLPRARLIHLMDREGDVYEVLEGVLKVLMCYPL